MAITISTEVMEITKVRKVRKTTEVFRFGNRDGSHIKIVVSPSSETGRRICIVPSSADGSKPPHTGPYYSIKAIENPKHPNKTKNLQESTSLWIARVYQSTERVLGLLGRREGEGGGGVHRIVHGIRRRRRGGDTWR